jgi:zinc transport system permease protein
MTLMGLMKMFDDFFSRALIGGFGVAFVAGPLGCFIIWRRLAYFGDTLSHSALLGVAIALLLELNITLSVFIVSVLVALMLLLLQKRASLSSDALLGLLAHSVLAIGLVVLAFMSWVRVDLMGFLFGDILAITTVDLALIWGGGAVVLAILAKIWKALFAATVSYNLALAEGGKPDQVNLVFMVLMAAVIAVSMKIVGVLLITALLIIPAAAARRFATSPEQMAVVAIILGIVSVYIGLNGSLEFDTPAGPSIVVAALACFVLSVLPLNILRNRTGRSQKTLKDPDTGVS